MLKDTRENSVDELMNRPVPQPAEENVQSILTTQCGLQNNLHLDESRTSYAEQRPFAHGRGSVSASEPPLFALPPPRSQRRAFMALANVRHPCRCFRRNQLNSWDATIVRFKAEYQRRVCAAEKMYNAALRMMQMLAMYLLVQILSIVLYAALLCVATQLVRLQESIALPTVALVVLTVHVAVENVYYLFLTGKIGLQSCCANKEETQQSVALFFAGTEIILTVVLAFQTKSLIESDDTGLNRWGIVLAIFAAARPVADSLVLHVICAVYLVVWVIILFWMLLFYSIVYLFYYTFCDKCGRGSARVDPNSRLTTITLLLDEITLQFQRGVSTHRCSICLAEYAEGDRVAIFDCSASHVFHYVCARDWLMGNNLCPVCRAPVFPQEVYETFS